MRGARDKHWLQKNVVVTIKLSSALQLRYTHHNTGTAEWQRYLSIKLEAWSRLSLIVTVVAFKEIRSKIHIQSSPLNCLTYVTY